MDIVNNELYWIVPIKKTAFNMPFFMVLFFIPKRAAGRGDMNGKRIKILNYNWK